MGLRTKQASETLKKKGEIMHAYARDEKEWDLKKKKKLK